MIEYHQGFIAGFLPGVTMGLGLMKMAWDNSERRRQRASCRRQRASRRPTFAELLMPLPRDQDPDLRRSINHENTNAPSGPPPLLWSQVSRRLPTPRWENRVNPPGPEEKIRNLTDRVQRLEEAVLNGGARD